LKTPGGYTAYGWPVTTPLCAPVDVYAVMTCEW
jgi:hypothetical protein